MSKLSEALFAGNRELSESQVIEAVRNFTFETKDGETYDIPAATADDAITSFHRRFPVIQNEDIIAFYDESDIHYCPISGEELDEFLDVGAPNINLNLDASGQSVGILGGKGGDADDDDKVDEGLVGDIVGGIGNAVDRIGKKLPVIGGLFEGTEDGFSVGDKVYYVDDDPKVPGEIVEIHEDGTCDVVVNDNSGDVVNVDMKMLDYWDDSQMECTMTEDTVRKSNGKKLRESKGTELKFNDGTSDENWNRVLKFPDGNSEYYVEYKFAGENEQEQRGHVITSDFKALEDTFNNCEYIEYWDYLDTVHEEGSTPVTEDTVRKSNGKWTNRGDDGKEHGEFDTKAEADAQRRAIFAQGYRAESVDPDKTYVYSTIIVDPVDDYERDLVARDGMKCKVKTRTDEDSYECEFEDGSEFIVFGDELAPVIDEGRKLIEEINYSEIHFQPGPNAEVLSDSEFDSLFDMTANGEMLNPKGPDVPFAWDPVVERVDNKNIVIVGAVAPGGPGYGRVTIEIPASKFSQYYDLYVQPNDRETAEEILKIYNNRGWEEV